MPASQTEGQQSEGRGKPSDVAMTRGGADRESMPSLVSVIIPCYNQGHYLGEAVESVLAQTYRQFEIVVVDDGSTDNTSEVAARYPSVRCVRKKNGGLSAARNTGFRESTGDFLVFLDADDRLLPNALQSGMSCFKSHPECGFVYGRSQSISTDGVPIPTPHYPCVEKEHYLELLSRNYIYAPAMVMYRRGAVEAVNGFDGAVNAAADYDIYLRIARLYPIHCHDEAVAEYRQHDASMSRKAELMLIDTTNVLRRQWKHVRKSRAHREAYRKGVRQIHMYYGERIVSRVRRRVREGREWGGVARDLFLLARYFPRSLVTHSLRKVSSTILRSKSDAGITN